jgi:two-component system, NarL family, sensor histidine kinase DevS
LTVQRAESRTAQPERQVLADRDRITRDLHEHVIGWLSGIGLTLHDTQHLAKSPAVAARIADHIEHPNQVITEVRASGVDRHTEPAGTQRLGGLLHDIVGEITAGTDPRTSIGINGRIDIVPADLAVHPRAVPREAVSNTAARPRHGTDRHRVRARRQGTSRVTRHW